MLFRRALVSFCLLFGCFVYAAEGANLHAILVVDTNAYDLREAMISNYWCWQIQLKSIARHSDLDLKTYIFKDDRANSNFIDELRGLSVDSDDVILFYWSGHGFRTNEKDASDNPWPSFSFNGESVGFDLAELTGFLNGMHPRLLISIADTCNNYIPDLFAPPIMSIKKMQKMDVPPALKSNHYRLFRESSGVIMAAGCQPGQYAWAYIPIGSIFTLSFMDALNDLTASSDDISWELIFQTTLKNLVDYEPPDEQTPVIDINLK